MRFWRSKSDRLLGVAECRRSKTVAVAHYGDVPDHARRWQLRAGPGTSSGGGSPQIVFLDTLAQDVRKALALLEQALPWTQRRPGWYFRLNDVGEVLALIDQAGLLPRTKPAWYLRLKDFSGTNH